MQVLLEMLLPSTSLQAVQRRRLSSVSKQAVTGTVVSLRDPTFPPSFPFLQHFQYTRLRRLSPLLFPLPHLPFLSSYREYICQSFGGTEFRADHRGDDRHFRYPTNERVHLSWSTGSSRLSPIQHVKTSVVDYCAVDYVN